MIFPNLTRTNAVTAMLELEVWGIQRALGMVQGQKEVKVETRWLGRGSG